MVKRLFDIVVSLTALVLLSPVFLLTALGIRLLDGGPIFFLARRVGLNGELFTMHKFRTMRVRAPTCGSGTAASVISSSGDSRVFPFGNCLRRLKIDELPQLYNVLRGKMSIVGPRPEDPAIVRDHYAPEHRETLTVRPGLASPGSIYNYTHGEKSIGRENPERDYVERLLPVKLALEQVYVRNASLGYDLRVIFRTVWVILRMAFGKECGDPPEMARIDRLVPARNTENP